MARDWDEIEHRIHEKIDQGLARAAERARRHQERAQRKAERMRERFDRHARRAEERAAQSGVNPWPAVGAFGVHVHGCKPSEPGAWVGVIICAVGVGLLMANFGVLAFETFVKLWPLLLVAAGAQRVARAKFSSAKAFGIFLMITGFILFLDNFGVVHMSWNLFWPAILIGVGLKHLMRNFDPPQQQQTATPGGGAGANPSAAAQPPPQPPPPVNPLGDWNTAGRTGPETPSSGPRAANDVPPPPRADFVNPSGGGGSTAASPDGAQTTTLGPDVYLHEYCIFTGGRRRIVSDNFRGGELVACFGGIDVDLRNCIMGGNEATIDVTAAFGGCTIRVPLNWYVEMRCVAAFGGSSNKTIPPRGGPGQRIPKLIITGSAAFGGVVVEN